MQTFAIVIPNLNQSHFLPWALESLRNQARPFNLAIMDGGSTDNFEEAIGGYSDMITYLHVGPDGGQAAAIRKGKETIPGDIVSWLNADDYYFPETLEKVASVFDMDSDVDVVYGNAVHVTSEGFFLSYFPAIQTFDAEDLTRSCFICQPACFVRRSAYERSGGLDPALRYTMDWDMWCRLAQAGARFQYVPDVLAAVRYYPETKTLSRDWRRYKEIWRIERIYGRRLLPLSWPGFYRFDLACKKKRTWPERVSLRVLDQMRNHKRLLRFAGLKNGQKQSIYGFRPWETVVERQCLIQVPWYDRRDWKRLHLEVEPGDEEYLVTINDAFDRMAAAREGLLSLDLPRLKGPHRKVTVSCPGRTHWKLLAFRCDLG
jgi:glycosyltransferase involved in cell wall biosynthesis